MLFTFQLDGFSAGLTAQADEFAEKNTRFMSLLDKDFESGNSIFVLVICYLFIFMKYCVLLMINIDTWKQFNSSHTIFIYFVFLALKNSATLGEELEGMFHSFSENILKEVEATKDQMNTKATKIEEVSH